MKINNRRTLSLVMVAIFTSFVLLSGIPASAITKPEAAKLQLTLATKYVVAAEKYVTKPKFVVKSAQVAVRLAKVNMNLLPSYGKAYRLSYEALLKRIVIVQTKIIARNKLLALIAAAKAKLLAEQLAAEKLAAAILATANDSVDLLEAAVNPTMHDLYKNAADLDIAQKASATALINVYKLPLNSSSHKGLLSRIDSANAKIKVAVDKIAADKTAQEAAAMEAAAVVKAEASVKAVEAAPYSNDVEVAAGIALEKVAATDILAVRTQTTSQALTARIAAYAAKVAAFTANAIITSISAVDGVITIGFDKVPKANTALVFGVSVVVNGGVGYNVPVSSFTLNGLTGKLVVPTIAPIVVDQNVVYKVEFQNRALTAANYVVPKLQGMSIVSAAALNKTQIQVVFNQRVDNASAIIPANYKLNGNVLGSTSIPVLQADSRTVIITAGSSGGFNTTTLSQNAGYIITVNNVKSFDTFRVATDIKSSAFTYAGDTTRPTMNNLVLNSDGTMTIGFNEPVYGAFATDFIIRNGNTNLSANTTLTSATDFRVQAGVNGATGKVVVVFKTPITKGTTVTVTTNSVYVKDAAGNVANSGTTQTVVK